MAHEYKEIQKWGDEIVASQKRTDKQIEMAIHDEAPANAMYKAGGVWHTTDDIVNMAPTNYKEKLVALLEGLEIENISELLDNSVDVFKELGTLIGMGARKGATHDINKEPKLEITDEPGGYGNCPDCLWHNDPHGCNVKRGSEICKMNKRPKIGD